MTVLSRPLTKAHTALLLVSVFVNGALVLVVEILGARLIGPFFGTTIFVWSSLITVTLGGLAVGYFAGGVISKSELHNRLFFWSANALAGITLIMIPLLVGSAARLTENLGLRFGPLLTAFLLFLPFFFFEGLLAPLAIHIRAAERHTGMTAGALYAFSTTGSLVGALLAGFFLVPLFPHNLIFRFSGILLAALGAIGIYNAGRHRISLLCILALTAFLIVTGIISSRMNRMEINRGVILEKKETFYSSLTVWEESSVRCLFSDIFTYTCVDKEAGAISRAPFTFIKDVINPYIIRLRPPARVLALGGGAGAYLEALPEGVAATVVEIDPATVDLGARYFGFDVANPNITVLVDDARHALRELARGQKTYNLILIDTFSGVTIPFHILTAEAIADFSRVLSEDGVVIVNGGVATAFPVSNDRYVNSIVRSAKTAFSHAAAFWSNESVLSNIIFYFSKTLPPNIALPALQTEVQAPLLTDNFSPLEYYGLERNLLAVEVFRKGFADIFPR